MTKVASVHFNYGNKTYHYFTYLDLKQGDPVIVDSTNGLGLAWVVDPDVQGMEGKQYASAWILDKIDAEELRKKLKTVTKGETS